VHAVLGDSGGGELGEGELARVHVADED